MDKGGGGSITIFFQIFFWLTVPKKFVQEPFRVSIISGTEKICEKTGGAIKIFCRKFFVSQCRNFPSGGNL